MYTLHIYRQTDSTPLPSFSLVLWNPDNTICNCNSLFLNMVYLVKIENNNHPPRTRTRPHTCNKQPPPSSTQIYITLYICTVLYALFMCLLVVNLTIRVCKMKEKTKTKNKNNTNTRYGIHMDNAWEANWTYIPDVLKCSIVTSRLLHMT